MRALPNYLKTLLILISFSAYITNAASSDTIKTSTVKELTLAQNITLDAQVEAINQTTLSAQTSGQITEIFFEAGDIVSANSTLLTLKDDNQQANYKSSQATLKATKAELVDAKKSLARIKDVFAKKLAPQQDVDTAKARFNIAKANYERANAQLNSSKEQLNYTLVKAPYAGIVLERHVNLGEVVAPGTPLFTGTSLSQLRVISQIPQKDIERVRQFSSAEIILPNGQTYTRQQDAIKFYAYASPQSGTFKVRITLPAENKILYPGMHLKVAFKTGNRTALVVPNKALIKRSELRAVYVLDSHKKIHLRQIRVGQIINNSIEILAGLSAGEQIITNPSAAITTLQVNANINEVK